MKTISFSILFSTLQLFFNPLFFAFLQQFTAGENLRVAGDSAGRQRILTTLNSLKTLHDHQYVAISKFIYPINPPSCDHFSRHGA